MINAPHPNKAAPLEKILKVNKRTGTFIRKSRIYQPFFQLIIYLVFCVGFDLAGIWFGPFPVLLCEFINISKAIVYLSFISTFFIIFIIIFMFVCVWRKMKIMNDFLIFHIITRTVVIYAVYLSIMKSIRSFSWKLVTQFWSNFEEHHSQWAITKCIEVII